MPRCRDARCGSRRGCVVRSRSTNLFGLLASSRRFLLCFPCPAATKAKVAELQAAPTQVRCSAW